MMRKSAYPVFIRIILNPLTLLLIAMMITTSYSRAQNAVAVSNSNVHDTIKIEKLYALAGKYWSINIDTATYFVEQAFELSQKIGYMDGIGQGYGFLGVLSGQRGDLRESIDYYLKCLKVIQEQGYESQYPRILNNLALLHLQLENYAQAKLYYEECVELNKKNGIQKSLASNYNNLALIYRNFKDFNNSYDYYQRAIEIRMEIKDSLGLATSYSNLGTLYEDQKQLQLAQSFYQKSLIIRRLISDRKGCSTSLYKLGNIYFNNNQFEQALKSADESYKIASKWGYKSQEKESAEVLYKIHKAKNNVQLALRYYEISNKLADSLNNNALQKKLIESEYQLAYNKKYIVDSLKNAHVQVENELLEKKNALNKKSIAVQRLWLLIAALLVIALIVSFVLFRKNAKANELQLRTDVKLRLSEVLALQNQLIEQDAQEKQEKVHHEHKPASLEGVNIILQEKLTEREQEVLDALVFGFSNKEIGEKLFLSVNTIKSHINSLYVKLDVNNRTQAAVKGSLLKINEQSRPTS